MERPRRESKAKCKDPQKVKVYERVFATVAEKSYFPGLWALLNSIYAYHQDELRVFVFDCGLTVEQREGLGRHPLAIEVLPSSKLAFPPVGPWETKQQVFAELLPIAKSVMLLDCDL